MPIQFNIGIMHLLLLLLAGVLAASGAPKTGPQRIVGGTETTIDRYPYQAALLFSTDFVIYSQSCGGTILNQRSILSAAHCVWAAPNALHYRIRVGSTFASSGGVVHNVAQLIDHPSYSPFTMDSDINIIRSATAITFNNNVQPGAIAGPNYNVADNQVVWASGWGRTTPNSSPSEQLRHVQIWTVNQADCRARFGSVINDNMLCAGWQGTEGRGQCTGDSGGPLSHNGVVIGVCSFTGQYCDDPTYPSVNVRVSRFTSWIQANA